MKVFKWLINNADPFFALIAALACTILGIFGILKSDILLSVILGTLTVLAFTLIRERAAREKILEKLEVFSNRIEAPIADQFFSKKTEEKILLESTDKEVWLVQETGSLITESNRASIINLLNRGGRVRMTLSSPDTKTAKLMALRNANLNDDALITRSKLFQSQIQNIIESTGQNAEKLEVRYIPYPIGFTYVGIDPEDQVKSKRKALVRYADYRVPFAEKLDFQIRGDNSPKTFMHYFKQAHFLFQSAYKIVLVTGEPRSGKTTLIRKMLQKTNLENVFFVISSDIRENEERVGFEVQTSNRPEPLCFATKNGSKGYDVDASIWDRISQDLMNAKNEGKIIILDEIGPMQLRSVDFQQFIAEYIFDPLGVLFGTIALDNASHKLLPIIKASHRTTILNLKKNEDLICSKLISEFNDVERTTRFLS